MRNIPTLDETNSAFDDDFSDVLAAEDIDYEFSDRHKIRMNRIFRRFSKKATIPYPEVDNLFERILGFFAARLFPLNKG